MSLFSIIKLFKKLLERKREEEEEEERANVKY
jgi:hypothetical protein